MNEKFFDLSREKQDRMINGAIEVFAQSGYKHASTDDMVKAVGVSKGLWFHYFGSKSGLYQFVYGYSVKYFVLELASVLDTNETDFFEITKQIEYTKMRVGKNYPYMMYFLEQAITETDSEIVNLTQEDRKIYNERVSGLSKTGEIDGIPEKAQKDRIKKMVNYTIAGIKRDKSMAGNSDAEAAYKEIKTYIDMIRNLTKGAKNIESGKENTGSSIIETVA